MTILFAGTVNSDMDFFSQGGNSSNTTWYDTAWTVQAITGNRSSFPKTKQWRAPASDFWFHFLGHCTEFQASYTGGDYFLQLYDSADVPRFKLRCAPASQLQMQTSPDGVTWTNVGSPLPLASSPVATLKTQWDIKFTSGSSGGFELYFNKVFFGSVVGDISAAGTSFQALALRPTDNNGNVNLGCSELIVATTSTLNMRYKFNYATSDSAVNTAFTGTYLDVDELVFNRDDFIYSGTAGDIETMLTSARTFTGYAIETVQVSYVALKGVSGPQHLQATLRIGSTNYSSGVDQTLSYGFTTHHEYFDVDPSTTVTWTPAAAGSAALEFGVKATA